MNIAAYVNAIEMENGLGTVLHSPKLPAGPPHSTHEGGDDDDEQLQLLRNVDCRARHVLALNLSLQLPFSRVQIAETVGPFLPSVRLII